MSPTQSTSTKSAHNESDALGIHDVYYLSDYAFQIQRNSVASSTYDQITAVCTYKDGKNARQAIQLPSTTKLSGYYVEANETEASVYAIIKTPTGESEMTSQYVEGSYIEGTEWTRTEKYLSGEKRVYEYTCYGCVRCRWHTFDTENYEHGKEVFAANSPTASYTMHTTYYDRDGNPTDEGTTTTIIGDSYTQTYDGKTVYYVDYSYSWPFSYDMQDTVPLSNHAANDLPKDVAWTLIYGTISGTEYETQEILVGRFAIDLGDAGGVGPGSDWDDSGDYDEDWEEGDPTKTLYVTVVGALSGRHNDPIEDPSYSYIPADKDTVKGYGCGGDGGHGGGGGAGASTVVVYKFATNQADGKEIVALAKRHGYGSGGGKGGKGGDGCILVYY